MKPFAIVAALLVLLPEAQPRPDARPPNGVQGSLAVLNAERMWAGADVLLGIRPEDAESRDALARALGRLEDPSLVPRLFTLGASPRATANAIAQSLHGFDPLRDPDLVQRAWEWMWTAAGGDPGAALGAPAAVAAVALPMARITYADARHVQQTEKLLAMLAAATANTKASAGHYVTAMQALESLARLNTKLVHFDEATIRRLTNAVRNVSMNDDVPEARRYALFALAAGRALQTDIARVALDDNDWQTRRAATQFLAGAGAADQVARLALILQALRDDSAHVRYDAVHGYASRFAFAEGCQPLLDALGDDDMTVVLEALDALGDRCQDSEEVTMRVVAEVRAPPIMGSWQREAHAFVALAKRSPERAALAAGGFVAHPLWWVRMYAAYGVAAAGDLERLETLAYDADDNVREAALGALRGLDKDRAVRAALDALQQRGDAQLLRTAAILLKELPPTPMWSKPLLTALRRLTKDGRITSRDARLELLDAIDRHGSRDNNTELTPLLRDYDPRVAERAALVMGHLSGRSFAPDPQRRAPASAAGEFGDLQQCVAIEMTIGRSITLRMLPGSAPIAVEQFLRLGTKDKYYDGLAFHRVVPNFVIQGGSPGANEYAGNRDYLRDEVDAANTRGTVALSTRGRNTGDGQFFVNLVDNPRLDGDYTVFATVENMEEVDRIQEGDTIRRMKTVSCGAPKPRG